MRQHDLEERVGELLAGALGAVLAALLPILMIGVAAVFSPETPITSMLAAAKSTSALRTRPIFLMDGVRPCISRPSATARRPCAMSR